MFCEPTPWQVYGIKPILNAKTFFSKMFYVTIRYPPHVLKNSISFYDVKFKIKVMQAKIYVTSIRLIFHPCR
jgi:hypothetical protein